jgi:hypothetical protein
MGAGCAAAMDTKMQSIFATGGRMSEFLRSEISSMTAFFSPMDKSTVTTSPTSGMVFLCLNAPLARQAISRLFSPSNV